ncbi:MAG: hypothetical protein ACK2U4_12060 [Candidatus Promineifilaceae bacterium]
MIEEKVTGTLVPGSRRSTGKDSTAQASDAHSDRMARFWLLLSAGSSTTSWGNVKERSLLWIVSVMVVSLQLPPIAAQKQFLLA